MIEIRSTRSSKSTEDYPAELNPPLPRYPYDTLNARCRTNGGCECVSDEMTGRERRPSIDQMRLRERSRLEKTIRSRYLPGGTEAMGSDFNDIKTKGMVIMTMREAAPKRRAIQGSKEVATIVHYTVACIQEEVKNEATMLARLDDVVNYCADYAYLFCFSNQHLKLAFENALEDAGVPFIDAELELTGSWEDVFHRPGTLKSMEGWMSPAFLHFWIPVEVMKWHTRFNNGVQCSNKWGATIICTCTAPRMQPYDVLGQMFPGRALLISSKLDSNDSVLYEGLGVPSAEIANVVTQDKIVMHAWTGGKIAQSGGSTKRGVGPETQKPAVAPSRVRIHQEITRGGLSKLVEVVKEINHVVREEGKYCTISPIREDA